MKENLKITFELTSLCEQVENFRVDAVSEFQTSTEYYDEMGVQFNEGFRHFHIQALKLLKDSGQDFSQVLINLEEPLSTTPGVGEPVPDGVLDLDTKKDANGKVVPNKPIT